MKLDTYLNLPYQITVGHEECTDGTSCYMARVTDLPGCEYQGDSREEALDGIEEVKAAFLTAMLENGVQPPLPAPRLQGVATSMSETSTCWIADVKRETEVTAKQEAYPQVPHPHNPQFAFT